MKPTLFRWNACNFEETEEKRLVFSEFFPQGNVGECIWGMIRVGVGVGACHCLIRQLKDTSAEEIRIDH